MLLPFSIPPSMLVTVTPHLYQSSRQEISREKALPCRCISPNQKARPPDIPHPNMPHEEIKVNVSLAA